MSARNGRHPLPPPCPQGPEPWRWLLLLFLGGSILAALLLLVW